MHHGAYDMLLYLLIVFIVVRIELSIASKRQAINCQIQLRDVANGIDTNLASHVRQ